MLAWPTSRHASASLGRNWALWVSQSCDQYVAAFPVIHALWACIASSIKPALHSFVHALLYLIIRSASRTAMEPGAVPEETLAPSCPGWPLYTTRFPLELV